jgi:predicted ATP-binding protein involved in virulence
MPDDVDSTTTVEDTGSTGSDTSTADTSGASSDTQAGTTSPGADTTSGASELTTQTDSTTQTQQSRPATGAPANTAQPGQQQTSQPIDWQDRYKNLQSAADRKLAQASERLKQHEQELAQFRDSRQRQENAAKQAGIKRWMPQHPEHNKFKTLREKADFAQRQAGNLARLQGLSPEQHKQVEDAMFADVMSTEDRAELQEQQAFTRDFLTNLAGDPHSALAPILGPMIEQQIQARIAQAEEFKQVQQAFEDPAVKALVPVYGEHMLKAVRDGVPADYVAHMTKTFAELENARNQLAQLQKSSAQGQAQVQQNKQRATLNRTPAPQTAKLDPYQEAKKRAQAKGISTDDPRFLTIVEAVEREQR